MSLGVLITRMLTPKCIVIFILHFQAYNQEIALSNMIVLNGFQTSLYCFADIVSF